MKKLLLSSIATAVLLSTGIGFGEKAEAAKVKETKIDYLSKTTAKKVKDGKINSLDGIKLDTPKSKYVGISEYNICCTQEIVEIRNSYNSEMLDFDYSKPNAVFTRLVDYVYWDKNRDKLTLSNMRKLYGKPKKGYSLVFKDNNQVFYQVDIYKNHSFFYRYERYVGIKRVDIKLDSVVYHGKEIKNHLSTWKNYLKGEWKLNPQNAPTTPIPTETWKKYLKK